MDSEDLKNVAEINPRAILQMQKTMNRVEHSTNRNHVVLDGLQVNGNGFKALNAAVVNYLVENFDVSAEEVDECRRLGSGQKVVVRLHSSQVAQRIIAEGRKFNRSGGVASVYINQLDTARERDIKIVKKRQRIGQRTQLDKEAVPDERAGAKEDQLGKSIGEEEVQSADEEVKQSATVDAPKKVEVPKFAQASKTATANTASKTAHASKSAPATTASKSAQASKSATANTASKSAHASKSAPATTASKSAQATKTPVHVSKAPVKSVAPTSRAYATRSQK